MTRRYDYDLLVIGAGSGGLSIAAGAVQMGARVALLEGHKMGGDCLNYGCVPSKALIAAARAAHQTRGAAGMGVTGAPASVDFPRVMAHVRDVIATIAPTDSQERFEGLGVDVIRAFGRFVSPGEVEAGDRRISARRIVIATGSRPAVPPIPGLDAIPYLTNETIFDLTELPAHLLIIGAGPIGLEMAQAFRRLGSAVTVLEAGKAMAREDPDAAAVVLDRLRSEGVEIRENAQVAGVAQSGSRIELAIGDGAPVTGSHLLVAAGRAANTERLNLKAAGIKQTRSGVKVDAGLRTTNRRVYAIGDAAGGLQFTHVAGYHASVIIRPLLFGLPARARDAHIPRATFTDPELAQIGLTEPDARAAHGTALEVARFDLSHNDRAIATRQQQGFIKVMIHRGRPVGATIVGPGAGEHAALWSLAIARRMKMSHLSSMVAPYPTISEIAKRANGVYFTPRLFDNPWIKRVVRFVQRTLP